MTITSERAHTIAVMTDRVGRGVASYGCRVFGPEGEDLTDEVADACDRAGYAGTSTRAVTREYDFELCRPGTGRQDGRRFDFDLADDAKVAGTIGGYQLRWETVTRSSADRDGNPGARVAYAPDAFDEWLEARADAGLTVKMQRDHRGEPIGQWLWLQADEYGLLGEAAIFDTPDGCRALEDARSGRLRGLSTTALQHPDDQTRAADDAGGFFLTHRAMLAEAGPVTLPADTGARILAVDGEPVDAWSALDDTDLDDLSADDLKEEIARFVGRPLAELERDARIEAAARSDQVDEQVRRIENCTTELKRARRRVRELWDYYRSGLAKYAEVAEAIAEADQHDAWLREHAFADTYRVLTAGLPARLDLGAEMLRHAVEQSRRHR